MFQLGTPSSSRGILIGNSSLGGDTVHRVGFQRTDVAFGFESGHIEHRTMIGDLVSTFRVAGDQPVRGLRFDRDGNLYAVTPTLVEKFRQIDGQSLGRWDVATTWDSTHIPWDIGFDSTGVAYIIWADNFSTGTEHGIHKLPASGASITETFRVTASPEYYDGEARQLKIDVQHNDTTPYLFYTDNFYKIYRVAAIAPHIVATQITLAPSNPWEAGGFRVSIEDADVLFMAQTRSDAPAGPRNALCLCADRTTMWADEINTDIDIQDPGHQHADRYGVFDNTTHVRRVTTSVNHPILSMDSWIEFTGPVPAVCGDIFVSHIDLHSFEPVISIIDGVTKAVKGSINISPANLAYGMRFDSLKNLFLALEVDTALTFKGSVWRFQPTSGAYSAHTTIWSPPNGASSTQRNRVLNVSVGSDDSLYILWIHDDTVTTSNRVLHLEKTDTNGTVVASYTIPSPNGVQANLNGVRGGSISYNGTKYYFSIVASGRLRISEYDLASNTQADFYNVLFADIDFEFFPWGYSYSGGLLGANQEGYGNGSDAVGVARKWAPNAGYNFSDYTPFNTLPNDFDRGYDVAPDFIANSFVVVDTRSPANGFINVLIVVNRIDVVTGARVEAAKFPGDDFGFVNVAVLCPAQIPFNPTSNKYIIVSLVGAN